MDRQDRVFMDHLGYMGKELHEEYVHASTWPVDNRL